MLEHMHNICTEAGIADICTVGGKNADIQDEFPHCGPMSGCHAAIQYAQQKKNAGSGHSRYSHIIVLPIDMPTFSPILLQTLYNTRNHATIVHFSSHILPLTCIVHDDVCTLLKNQLSNPHAHHALHALPIDYVTLPIPETMHNCLRNINTPDDWHALLAENDG